VTAAERRQSRGTRPMIGLTIASAGMFTPELRSGAVAPVLSEWSLRRLDLWAVVSDRRAATATAELL